MSVKQAIIFRRDLRLRRGQVAAQAAHAAIKIFFDRLVEVGDGRFEIGPCEDWDWDGAVRPWVTESFTKVVLGVDTEEEMLALEKAAQEARIPTAMMEDTGFGKEPVRTALALGPADSKDLRPLISKLRLL